MCSQEWEVILEGWEKSDRLQGFKEGSRGRRRGRPRGSTCGRRGRSEDQLVVGEVVLEDQLLGEVVLEDQLVVGEIHLLWILIIFLLILIF